MGKLIKKSDIVFTVVIAAIILLVWFLTLPREAGRDVVFRMNGEILATLPLSEDTVYEVSGQYQNTFEIKDGAVRVAFTDCPNHQCEKTGAISRAGQSIVCAPNGASATITGGEADIDGITG
ncbi:MAG: NusG domain II-containing protein [Christensenella sp.]|uniref:NusG domain II-containing protein n=1 Tax=Christensenella sp. TaxID=1935934 RepID=UPI002B20A7C0|nr:NusG domain II-containing protein [Christensenella sp.]MEA5002174.1 NusG domain II-containing protein [Christensenella sp.]